MPEILNLHNTSYITMVNISSNVNLSDFEDFVSGLRQDSLLEIILYSLLFVSGAIGNLWVFFKQRQKSQRDARINYLLRHLNYADMLVIFGTILIEIIWRITVYWHGGEILCKIVSTFRIFCVYLSSVMLICISVDRYFVFVHPLSFINREKRKTILIHASYVVSALSALPQAFIFHIGRHPDYPAFAQCLSRGYFDTEWKETVYQIFTLCIMYFVPFFVTLFCYIRIIAALSSQREVNITMEMVSDGSTRTNNDGEQRINVYQRAEKRTLRITSIVALAFVCCWTPYTFVVLWFQFNPDSYRSTNSLIMDVLFCFAVLNSVINPCVYSSHLFTKRRASAHTVNHTLNTNNAPGNNNNNNKTNYLNGNNNNHSLKMNGSQVIRGNNLSKVVSRETFF
ncbi:adipokinetic hormone/corazonin-related peptide receptor variant I-like [Panonychus citri]|uniref:adipokinetic hormone/corazonin-related peptide receptor variant I-like n=1 Tax=Panonychus citri TaxID=50023 RepID=UPI0023078244|nr:adipokinetic hormone/corazonin-related peptide receptor variant I-like [Panonychus citri]